MSYGRKTGKNKVFSFQASPTVCNRESKRKCKITQREKSVSSDKVSKCLKFPRSTTPPKIETYRKNKGKYDWKGTRVQDPRRHAFGYHSSYRDSGHADTILNHDKNFNRRERKKNYSPYNPRGRSDRTRACFVDSPHGSIHKEEKKVIPKIAAGKKLKKGNTTAKHLIFNLE